MKISFYLTIEILTPFIANSDCYHSVSKSLIDRDKIEHVGITYCL